MSDLERDSARATRTPWSGDLEALGDTTTSDLPTLAHSMARTRTRRTAATHWKERLMNTVETTPNRHWILAAGLAVLIAVAGLVVPISYERVTGHDVSLVLGNLQDVASATGVAQEMKAALGAERVAMRAAESGAGFELAAFVPSKSGMNAEARAQALAKELTARGFTATATATPHRERVSGSVYAYAKDLTIKIETEGKTPAQIENEIRQQLTAAGITNAKVEVTQSGKERKISVVAENHGTPGNEPRNIGIDLLANGVPAQGGTRVEMRKVTTPTGKALEATVTANGKTAQVTVPNVDQLSDAQLAEQVTKILKDAGLDLMVKVTNGHLQIEMKK